MTTTPDFGADKGLFDYDKPAPVSLADKFTIPPMSVLDRRSGDWQDRKRRWLSLGMQSELGRDSRANRMTVGDNFIADRFRGVLVADGVSVFDPVVCELAYRWHTRPGDVVLDPFAGGSVRGLAASILGRRYVGMDLRAEQVEANRDQMHLASPDAPPEWHAGDSTTDLPGPAAGYDLVFTCPPYGDLEVYSDDPRDLSTMSHDAFLETQAEIIRQAALRLKPDRFAVWVTSDIRDKKGAYRAIVGDTIDQFRATGMAFHNEAVMIDMVGAAAVRAERPFVATRKLTRVHQVMLVFVKGSPKAAAARLEAA